ncbi:MAG: helix-turn-helix transcriptional regulator [Candidatus Izemoplasmatales bacterium]|nr:helix-turn-helix transcriptional regulator [Candidatus Izemoplasmatales bacterium]
MDLGKIIKRLRVSKDMTQEDLANMLGTSIQSVSRWENEQTYPDITMLPIIANIFEITVDELLNVNTFKQQEEIKRIVEQDKVLWSQGKTDEREMILRESIKQFPTNFELKSLLLNTLYFQTAEDTEEGKKYQKETIELANYILEKCLIDEYRYHAMQTLVLVYKWQHQFDKAKEIAYKMPSMWSSKEYILTNSLKGDELFSHLQENIGKGIEWFCFTIKQLSDEYTDGSKSKVLLKFVELLNIIFENKDFGFYNERLSNIYLLCAIDSATVKNVEETLHYLSLAKEYALAYDEIKEPVQYKSILLNKLIYEPSKNLRSANKSCLDQVFAYSGYKQFDFIRDHEEFKKIINDL